MPWLCDVIAICLHAAIAAIRLFKLLFSRKCKYVTLFILLSQNAVYSYVYRTVYIASIYEYMAKMVVCALVGSRLDYANSVLFGATRKNISKLQKAQNFLARVACYMFSSVLQSHVLSSSSSTGSRLSTASTSK